MTGLTRPPPYKETPAPIVAYPPRIVATPRLLSAIVRAFSNFAPLTFRHPQAFVQGSFRYQVGMVVVNRQGCFVWLVARAPRWCVPYVFHFTGTYGTCQAILSDFSEILPGGLASRAHPANTLPKPMCRGAALSVHVRTGAPSMHPQSTTSDGPASTGTVSVWMTLRGAATLSLCVATDTRLVGASPDSERSVSSALPFRHVPHPISTLYRTGPKVSSDFFGFFRIFQTLYRRGKARTPTRDAGRPWDALTDAQTVTGASSTGAATGFGLRTFGTLTKAHRYQP